MAYLTDSKMRNTVELPVALPNTIVKQGDYLVVATVVVGTAQRLTIRSMNLRLSEPSVDPASTDLSNKVIPNLGLAYVVLRKDYISGVPGSSEALDYIFATAVGTVTRIAPPAVFTAPGTYSILAVNNMQPSNTSPVQSSTSIDFKLSVTGNWRLELSVE